VSEPARAFLLKLARALHTYGYPAHRLEEALARVAGRLGLRAQFFSMPTALFASFGSEDDQRTFQIRVDPGEVNLGKLARLHEVTSQVASGVLPPETGALRVGEIVEAPPPYSPLVSTLAFALASSGASRFFGGGLREVVAASGIGLAIGLLALFAGRRVGAVFEPLAAAVAAFLAAGTASLAGPVSAYVATLGGLIILVPGLALTTGMAELGTRNLMSGTARLAGAIGTFLSIGFGVALGSALGERLFGVSPAVLPVLLPAWTEWLALLVAPAAFVVLLKAEPKDAPYIVVGGIVAFLGARAGARFLGPELGAFVGALAVGTFGNAYNRLTDRPSPVPIVPGILLLVPGSLGFRSLSSLLGRDTLLGVETAFQMTLVAVSLATGLLFANVVLPPRPGSRMGSRSSPEE
jgi:uncharacterized membrane protein YjjP (DUF1212 family)